MPGQGGGALKHRPSTMKSDSIRLKTYRYIAAALKDLPSGEKSTVRGNESTISGTASQLSVHEDDMDS